MNTVTYASELRSIFNRNAYSTLIAEIGTQLNDRKDRFDKSDIIEQAVAVYSGDRLAWVDLIGRDHVDSVTGFDLEFKYISDGMFTKVQKLPKEFVNVKLKNSLGVHKGTTIDHPADFYMIGQQDAIAIISWEDIKDYLVAVPDGIEARIPFDKLSFIFTAEDIDLGDELIETDYKKIKMDAQRTLIETFL
ncbi:MAG: hypothetical protein H8D95_01780 [Candidatus Endolissoclinum sp.]|nr:hypothetical protein [Candidatus Endolissoclinum sp.]